MQRQRSMATVDVPEALENRAGIDADSHVLQAAVATRTCETVTMYRRVRRENSEYRQDLDRFPFCLPFLQVTPVLSIVNMNHLPVQAVLQDSVCGTGG